MLNFSNNYFTLALVKADLILAAINIRDPKHREAENVFNKYLGKLTLSPYSLVEIDLLLKSGSIVTRDVYSFWDGIGKMLMHYRIFILQPKPKYHSLAYDVRLKHSLSYFDSLHAAIAMCEKVPIISYDAMYKRVRNLTYLHPSDIV